MEVIYFSEDNFKRICKVIKQNIKDEYNISIRKREYKNNIIDVMKYSFSIKKQFNIDALSVEDKIRYLSQKAINFFLVYFKSKNEKKKSIKREKSVKNKERKIDINRPKATFKKDTENLEDKFKQLVDSRNIKPAKKPAIDFLDKNTPEHNNIEEKYLEITKSREDYYNSDNVPQPITTDVKENFSDLTAAAMDPSWNPNGSSELISNQQNIKDDIVDSGNSFVDSQSFNWNDNYLSKLNKSVTESDTKPKLQSRKRRMGDLKTKNIIIDVSGSTTGTHTVIFGPGNANTDGDAYISEDIKNVVSIKVNRLIIKENPIFRESIIADGYLESMNNKVANITEELNIITGRKAVAEEILSDLSGAYNTAFLHNFNISGVDVAAALEYTKTLNDYEASKTKSENASGHLYNVSGGNSVQISDLSGNEYEISYEISRLEYNQSSDSLDQAEFDASGAYQKKLDTAAIWESISGEVVTNDARKNIDAAANIMVANLSGELANISSDRAYAEQELNRLNTNASGLISDIMVFSNASGATYERDLEIAILERDGIFTKKELLIADASESYIKYTDAKNLWENISGISIINDVKADIMAQVAIAGISGEIDSIKTDKEFTETHLLNLSGDASTLNIDINISNASGAEYRKNLEIGILNRNRLLDEKQRAAIDLSGKHQKKTETMNLWMDISGIEINNDGLLRIDTAADIIIYNVSGDLSKVTIDKTFAITHLENLSGDADVLNIDSSILNASGAEYNRHLELAILNRNIASDETQRALIDLSGALQLKNDTFAVFQNISGYEADASGNNDFAGLVLIKEASANFTNASGAYVNASGVYNSALVDLVTKQKIVDVHRAKLEVFNLSGAKSSLETKLANLQSIRDNQLNLSGGDISARVLLKEIKNEYISALSAYTDASGVYSNAITKLDNKQLEVDIYRAKLDVFNISGELNKLEHQLNVINNAVNLSGGTDAAAEIIKKQVEINYVNASGEYFGMANKISNTETQYTTNQLIVDVYRIKLEVFNLSGETNNLINKLSAATMARNIARDISGGDVAARVKLLEAKINMTNASGAYTKSETTKNSKQTELDAAQKDFIYKKARWDYYNLHTNRNFLEEKLTDISGARYASEQLLNKEWDIAGYMANAKAKTEFKDISGYQKLLTERLASVTNDLSGKQNIQVTKKNQATQESEPYLLLCSDELEEGTLSGKVLTNVDKLIGTSIFAKLYPDINIMGYTHFINKDSNTHKFTSKQLSHFNFTIQNSKAESYQSECILMLEFKYL